MSKPPFGKFKSAMLPSPAPNFAKGMAKGVGSNPPHQSAGLAGIRPARRNNPLRTALTSLPPASTAKK